MRSDHGKCSMQQKLSALGPSESDRTVVSPEPWAKSSQKILLVALFMGRVFGFSVSFRTSPREVCWSGMGWLHMGRWRVKHYIRLGWFAVLRFDRPDSILSKHARLVGWMSMLLTFVVHTQRKKKLHSLLLYLIWQ